MLRFHLNKNLNSWIYSPCLTSLWYFLELTFIIPGVFYKVSASIKLVNSKQLFPGEIYTFCMRTTLFFS